MRSICCWIWLFCFVICADRSLPAQAPAAAEPVELVQAIEPLIKAHAGDVAVAIRHLKTGQQYQWNADRPQSTASLIKLPIMVEAYRQANEEGKDLHRLIEIPAGEFVEGSGILSTHFSPGMRLSLRDAVRLMMAFSDNTATNVVIEQIGLPATATTMAKWGYPETQLHSKVFKRETSIAPQRSQRFGLGSTTARDMVDLLAKIYARQIVSEQACQEMLAHLAACDDKEKFPALLPASTKVYHKTGSVAKVRTDAGIIETAGGPVALCVLTENNTDTSWSAENAGNRLCAEIAKATFDYFSDRAEKSTAAPAGAAREVMQLAKGDTGDMVEALQRTLNARVSPSPNLGVDGDFGPGTEAALKAFQSQQQLEVTGIADRKTLQALGPLLMEAEPVPDPEVINRQPLPKQAADDPFGQPVVTAKAWAIADAADGKLLWGHNEDAQLDIASTTKIMTAYMVLKYCDAHPEALSETITFSRRADKTNGSTAGVREGEKVSVGDLMYGLLLPSGNDASVALAEHFGSRLVKADHAHADESESYDAFIEAMNAEAQSLGLQKSRFVNPHGLTANEHKSSCLDLVKLALAAQRLPLFRKITSTSQYGCRVTGASGYVRNVKWENTNQLLSIEGYGGIKTGTTDAAGACLVSSGTRDDRELVVVVLGSAASASRYADTRNLFAWAWRQLAGPSGK